MASSASVVRNLQVVREKVAQAVAKSAWKQQCTLVAVSKTKPIEDLQAAYEHEQRHFGENYIQELIQKTSLLPSDVKWHYIGHVQSNKAKSLVRDVPNLYMVETVDSIKIANALNKASGEFRTAQLNVLVQVNTSDEDQKSGTTSTDESVELAQHIVNSCEHLRLAGLMTIGRYGDTTSECFDRLVACRKKIAEALNKPEAELDLSMGMSGDYELAISCGSTYVRVGSTIFGDRNYAKA
uniref:Pyridoxal phosphate homeostasis protein n=1 Tax=Globisporangium ultimum (strain ATCC 200006 / CBS 805.95 / DAOM BR144) TaxID=431595 RepID=K3WAQ7_GLOUD